METAEKTTWKLDPVHSEIRFKVKHMMISTLSGTFDEFEGAVKTSNKDFKNADFEFKAKIKSINTNDKERDAHVKSEDFFHAEKFPELTFQSKSFDGEKMTGELTIRDITKEITLDMDFNGIVDDLHGQKKAGFEGSGAINRKDFNLNWNGLTEAGKVVVSDKVKLIVDLQFTKQE